MPRRKPLFQPHRVRYEVSELIQKHIDSWRNHRRHRDHLQEGPLGNSASSIYWKNPETLRLETTRELLNIAQRKPGRLRTGDSFINRRIRSIKAPNLPMERCKSQRGVLSIFIRRLTASEESAINRAVSSQRTFA